MIASSVIVLRVTTLDEIGTFPVFCRPDRSGRRPQSPASAFLQQFAAWTVDGIGNHANGRIDASHLHKPDALIAHGREIPLGSDRG